MGTGPDRGDGPAAGGGTVRPSRRSIFSRRRRGRLVAAGSPAPRGDGTASVGRGGAACRGEGVADGVAAGP